MLKNSIPLKEETITPLTTDCYYCKQELCENCVKDHDHLNDVFRGLAHIKCNFQAENTFVKMCAYNLSFMIIDSL